MGENSFTSILILLVLFIVIPSVLKFLGQYTMSSKNIDKKRMQEPEILSEDGMHEYPGEASPQHDNETLQKEPVSNKPIKPKWF
jgi:hypothetical protein